MLPELDKSNADDDLEDGEIPSDEDDDSAVPVETKVEPPKPSSKSDSSKDKSSDSKSNNKSSNKKSSNSSSGSNNKSDRFGKYKNPSDDWAGDVEKAIRAALEENKSKNQDNKSKNKSSSNNSSSRSRNKKRTRDDKEDDRAKDQKRKKISDDENINDDDDEMLFVRGASPVRRENRESSPPPSRRSHDRDSIDNNSDRDSDGRSSRHRDHDKRSTSSGRGSSRRSKNDRGCKNKARTQLRNERSGRRNQNNDNVQDADSICVYYMQGKCHRGDDCPFSHNALPPRKMELCKFYLMDCCAKRDKCLYMHHDFPCKFFHTGLKCNQGDNCKFSHEPLNEQVKNILLKHLETAPKEILGEFPRLSREGALMMINNTARNLAQGQDASTQKIPSLFDVTLPAPTNNLTNNDKDDDGLNHMDQLNHQKKSNSSKDRKPAGKKTRWGSDDDRVPLEQIMLLQSVSQLGILPNVALSLAVQQQLQQRMLIQQCFANMDFYNEIQGNALVETEANKLKNKLNSDNKVDEKIQEQMKQSIVQSQDVDLRQLLTNNPQSSPSVTNVTDQVTNSTETKVDEESDHDGEPDLVIAVPTDDDDKNKDNIKDKSTEVNEFGTKKESSLEKIDNSNNNHESNQEMLPNLPKKAQELFLRIQQQQRAANDSIGNVDDKCAAEDASKNQDDWYSDDDDGGNDDDDDDDDDDEGGNLQIVIKDNLKDESEKSDLDTPTKENPIVIEPVGIPQPAVIVDKLGNLSKIDISAEVTKLLSSIKPQGSLSKKNSGVESPSRSNDSKNNNSSSDNTEKVSLKKSENGSMSPKSSSNAGSVSRDPRMSRDPRQRRTEETRTSSPSRSDSKKESQSLRLETSIYSSGITASDEGIDADFRAHDQDHRRPDLDLRQRYQQDFGDTDLRVAAGNFMEPQVGSDVDLRQMLSLPFKPAPSHVPCTEIDASIASHAPVSYKVYVVDIPRPNYSGLKLTKNDSLVKYDPRLRKIFRLSQSDIVDSPMSPPPVKPDTPKSPPPPPPQVRMDPRRKALEITMQSSQAIGSSGIMGLGIGSQQQSQDISMGITASGMQSSTGMGMAMGQNSMMNNIGLMNPMMNNSMQPQNMTPLGIGGMGNISSMGPNNSPIVPNQMGYDPRYQTHRNGGPGLLGPAPVLGFSDPRDGPNYDGPSYPASNFGNFGPNSMANEPMMSYGPNGPNNMNFGNNGQSDWANNNQNSIRRGGRIRRRNRNRTNAGSRNNRSPP
ncbi:protein suppressor of sable isoform X2 [Microplitis mediator]|uniref:protein suppressor of sable isoform X2 n=1 Tax=Microplitis mediator TaxID=375433 RepID=UPI002552537D|nr:protein suppressor of sable isoform X2 [Microplitis mediator]